MKFQADTQQNHFIHSVLTELKSLQGRGNALGLHVCLFLRLIVFSFFISNSSWYISNWFHFTAFCFLNSCYIFLETLIQSYSNPFFDHFILVILGVISYWDHSMKLMFLLAAIVGEKISWLAGCFLSYFSRFVCLVCACFHWIPGFSSKNRLLLSGAYIMNTTPESVHTLARFLIEGCHCPLLILLASCCLWVSDHSQSQNVYIFQLQTGGLYPVLCSFTVGGALLEMPPLEEYKYATRHF